MGGVPAKRTGSIVYDLPRCRARSFFSRMIEAQLVTGATQDMRILTGSALCAALAPKSAAAATLADINLDRRMRSRLGGGFCGRRPMSAPRFRRGAASG